MSDKIETINDLIKTCCKLLALACPDEISQYNETFENLDCTDAKNKLTFLFFQFLIWTLNKNKFTFEASQNKENRVKVSFIPYHISQNFEVKIENGKFNIYNKKSISVDSLNTLKLEMELLIGYSGQLNNLELTNKDLTLLKSPIFSGKIFEMPFVMLCNLQNENVRIAAESLLFSCQLVNNSDHIILNKVSADLLRETPASSSQHENFNGLNQLTNIVSEFMSYYAKLDKNPPTAKVSSCNSMYTAESQLLNLAGQAGVSEKLHPSIKKGATMHNFATQANAISKLLLGQQLLQNNNIFNKDMIKQCHSDDPKLTEIMLDLKS